MDTQSVVRTKYWHQLGDGRIQCDLCPRFCKLNDGQRGFCFVRACQNEEIVLTTYGRSSGFCIDPIEKKPLNHFYPGTSVLSFGTAGCNLGCKFCQNWDISKSREFETLAEEASPETIANAAFNLGCKSIAFTYNDPVIFIEYAIDVAIACREKGIKTVAVTAGEICDQPRVEFFEHIDAANIDLKAFTQSFYRNVCASNLQPVLDTLIYLRQQTDVWFEITNLVIPGENDSPIEICDMTSWIVENLGPQTPIHFTAFHPDFRMLDKPRTPEKTLLRARQIAIENGILYAYTGNIQHEQTSATYCSSCGAELIARRQYQISRWNIENNGICSVCKTRCAGHFEASPGNWGNRRQRVELRNYVI